MKSKLTIGWLVTQFLPNENGHQGIQVAAILGDVRIVLNVTSVIA